MDLNRALGLLPSVTKVELMWYGKGGVSELNAATLANALLKRCRGGEHSVHFERGDYSPEARMQPMRRQQGRPTQSTIGK